ncbi:helix-turn-helix domain-containing protein [Escherichia coli]
MAEYSRSKSRDLPFQASIRSVARPRQMAMALAKELTTTVCRRDWRCVGGRDHTTVLHACRRSSSCVKSRHIKDFQI